MTLSIMDKVSAVALISALLVLSTSLASATNSNDTPTGANVAALEICKNSLLSNQEKTLFVSRIREAARLLVEKKSQTFETAREDVRTFLSSFLNEPEVLSHQEKYRTAVLEKLKDLTPIKEKVLSLKIVNEIAKRSNAKVLAKKAHDDKLESDIAGDELRQAIFGSSSENKTDLSLALIEHFEQMNRPKEDLRFLYQEIEKMISAPRPKYEELAPLIDKFIAVMEFTLDQELLSLFDHSLSRKSGCSYIDQSLILNIFPEAIGKDPKAFGLTSHQFYVLKETYESAKFNIQITELAFYKALQLIEDVSLKFDVWERSIRVLGSKSVQ